MGKLSRERRERIQNGLEIGIAEREKRKRLGATPAAPVDKMLFCWNCGKPLSAASARAHIESCWGVKLRDDEPVPMLANREMLLRWIARRKVIKKEADLCLS